MMGAGGHCPDLPVNALTKAQRRRLVEAMKHFALPGGAPAHPGGHCTAGGVKTGEVDPGTMMSKKTAGLFFAGEILDLDAYTGASTSRLPGAPAGQRERARPDTARRNGNETLSQHCH
ncbi:MAG: hypothetical protein ACLR1T_02180 [Evtepia gabavorous]